MTRKQIERMANLLDQLAVAAFVGSMADLVLVGGRVVWDGAGILAGIVTFLISLRLTARLGGPRL